MVVDLNSNVLDDVVHHDQVGFSLLSKLQYLPQKQHFVSLQFFVQLVVNLHFLKLVLLVFVHRRHLARILGNGWTRGVIFKVSRSPFYRRRLV